MILYIHLQWTHREDKRRQGGKWRETIVESMNCLSITKSRRPSMKSTCILVSASSHYVTHFSKSFFIRYIRSQGCALCIFALCFCAVFARPNSADFALFCAANPKFRAFCAFLRSAKILHFALFCAFFLRKNFAFCAVLKQKKWAKLKYFRFALSDSLRSAIREILTTREPARINQKQRILRKFAKRCTSLSVASP